MKIAICLAHNYHSYDKPFVHSMFSILKHSAGKYELPVFYTGGLQLDEMRQNVVELATDYDYILLLDSDMSFPVDVVDRLVNHFMDKDIDVACGMYTYRKPPHLPMIYDTELKPINEFNRTKSFMIGATGLGVVMIKSSWLIKQSKPWFNRIKPCKEHPLGMGEEIYFFWKHKPKTLCDPTINCKHLFIDEVDVDTYIERNKLEDSNIVKLPYDIIGKTFKQLK